MPKRRTAHRLHTVHDLRQHATGLRGTDNGTAAALYAIADAATRIPARYAPTITVELADGSELVLDRTPRPDDGPTADDDDLIPEPLDATS